MSYLIIAGSIQGFILTFFLLTHKTANKRANVFLAILVCTYSIDMGLELFNSSSLVFKFPHLIGIVDLLLFLYGPLIYLYVTFLTDSNRSIKAKTALHFLPTALLFLYYIPVLFLQDVNIKLLSAALVDETVSTSPFAITYTFRDNIWIISCVHEIVYILFSLITLRHYSKQVKSLYSSLEKINLRWLRILLIATDISVLVSLLFALIIDYEFLPFEDTLMIILFCSAVIIYLIGYMGIRQPEIFIQDITTSHFDIDKPKEKYAKSKLDDERIDRYIRKLQVLMTGEKLYLQPTLKLKDVADRLSISTNNLSQVINDTLGKNFYDFINFYRIEAAKEIMPDPTKQHLTLHAVALEVGFNSKSSFNSVFKKLNHKTPSQYKREKLGEKV